MFFLNFRRTPNSVFAHHSLQWLFLAALLVSLQKESSLDEKQEGFRHALQKADEISETVSVAESELSGLSPRSEAEQTGAEDSFPVEERVSFTEEFDALGHLYKRISLYDADTYHFPVRIVEKFGWDASARQSVLVSKREMAADRILVKLQESASLESIDLFLDSQPGLSYSPIDQEGLILLSASAYDEYTVEFLMQNAYASIAALDFVEPDYIVKPSLEPNDPRFAEQWGLSNTGFLSGIPDSDIWATSGWDRRTDASSIIVAVIDTGTRYTHEDLIHNIWVNTGEVPNNGIDDDGNGYVDDVHGYDVINGDGDPMDTDNHGTHVTGIIGALGNNARGISGVVWKTQLMPIKFLDGGFGSVSGAIAGMNYAIKNGASIINASWGDFPHSLGLSNKITDLNDLGIIVVAAAGNNAQDIDAAPTYPASYSHSNIVTVAALTSSDKLYSRSNYGPSGVDIAAPGFNILSTWGTSDSSYQWLTGTSMAAPMVTGILALLRSEFPDETHLELIDRLYASAVALPALEGKVKTGGRANLHQAFNLAPGVQLPAITRPLVDMAYPLSGPMDFYVGAQGDGILSSEWYRSTTAIGSGQNGFFQIDQASFSHSGEYIVAVQSDLGETRTGATVEVLASLQGVGDAVDAASQSWAGLSSGPYWNVDSTDFAVGTSALKSGVTADNQSSKIQTIVQGAGTVTFRWKVSSEPHFDHLHFFIDGVQKTNITGEVDWREYTVELEAGTHTLLWEYRKDSSKGSGSDSGSLDGFVFTPSPEEDFVVTALNYYGENNSSENNWLNDSTLGYVNVSYFPWSFHAEHGWWYGAGTGSDSYWFYDLQLGWLWTSDSVYPYIWINDDDGWFYYLSEEGGQRWFYSFTTKQWTRIPQS